MGDCSEYLKETVFPGPIDIKRFEYAVISGEHEVDNEDYESSKDTTDDSCSRRPNRQIPYFLNPFIAPNAGIYLSYFSIGIAMYILSAPLSYYLINYLDVSATQYSAFSTLIGLPWSLKFLLGILSDSVPIFGYRRKSWMIFGWLMYVFSNFYMAGTGGPSFTTTTILMFLLTCSYLLSDVCSDALCVERSRLEFEEIKGLFQTGAYSIRSFGCVIGAVLGAMLYNTEYWGWGLSISQLFILVGIIPVITMLPSLWHLEEISSIRAKAPSISDLFIDIWNTLQLRAVWYPMIFIYTYFVLQIPNAAWTNFLVVGLNFSDFQIGMISIAAAVLFWAGMQVYKMVFFDSSWRWIFLFTTVVNTIFSLGQVVLIMRWNVALGIPDIVFALGDSAIVYFINAISYMPVCIMFMMLCPEGSEGVTYALLTTMNNLSGSVAYDLGTGLTIFFDVSNDTLAAGNFNGVLWLTIVTSLLQISPLLLLHILPDSREEQRKLRDSGERSWFGGAILLSVLVVSLLGTIIMNVAWIMV